MRRPPHHFHRLWSNDKHTCGWKCACARERASKRTYNRCHDDDDDDGDDGDVNDVSQMRIWERLGYDNEIHFKLVRARSLTVSLSLARLHGIVFPSLRSPHRTRCFCDQFSFVVVLCVWIGLRIKRRTHSFFFSAALSFRAQFIDSWWWHPKLYMFLGACASRTNIDNSIVSASHQIIM